MGNMNKLIGAMLSIVVGVTMLPVVTDTIDTLELGAMPAGVEALVDLLPILFVVIIVGGAVAYIRMDK